MAVTEECGSPESECTAVSLGTVMKGWQWLVQYKLVPCAVSACHL